MQCNAMQCNKMELDRREMNRIECLRKARKILCSVGGREITV